MACGCAASGAPGPQQEDTSLVAPDQERLVSELRNRKEADAWWAFATGVGVEPENPAAIVAERDRRQHAARALGGLEGPTEEAIDALIAGLQSEVLALPPPPQYGEYPASDRRTPARALVWEFERQVAPEIAAALAIHMHRDEQVLRRAVEALRNHPAGLAWAISWPLPEHSALDRRPVAIPPDLAPAVIGALVQFDDIPTPFESRQGWIIVALGRLPTDDPRRLDTLKRLVYSNDSENGPPAALAAIGFTRPFTTDLLDLIRDHLDDPRSSMRSAAIAAAGNAGEAALPVLDDLLARGRQRIDYAPAYDIARAAERIAPQDSRVRQYLSEYREARSRRR